MARQERHRQRGVLPGALSRRAADARRADARVAVAGGGGPAAASAKAPPPNARVYLRGVNDAKFRRQVVPGDRLRLEVTLEPAARDAGAGAGRRLSSTIRSSPRRTAAGGWCPTAPRSTRPRSSSAGAQIGEGTVIGPHAVDRRARDARRATAGSARRRSSTAGPRSATSTEIFPFASIGLDPAGPEVPGRGDAAGHRPAQHLPRVRHDPPRHPRRRRRHRRSATATCSWPTCTSRTTATSATTRFSATWRRSAAT